MIHKPKKKPQGVKTQSPPEEPQFSTRAMQYKRKLDDLLDTKKLAEFLYLDRDLTREEFDAKVIELGYRAALRTLTAEACKGDTKALDLFLKRCDLHFSQHRQVKKEDDSQASPSYKPRTPDPKE